jgi:hypothetical protein
VNKLLRFGLALGLILVLFPCSLAVDACVEGVTRSTVSGSGHVAIENRPVSGVSGVALGTIGDLTIELGDRETLRVEADDNLLQYFKTTVHGGVLTIDSDPDINLRPKESIHFYLSVKGLESLELSSVGSITAPALTAGHFAVSLSSTGDIDLAGLEAESLKVRLSSSGNVTIATGQVGSQDISLTSSGDYEAGDVRSTSATVDISSSGNAKIWVTDRLKADLSSSGSVRYYGSPALTVDASSAGDAESLGDK